MAHASSDNLYGPSTFVVDALPGKGSHTTISSALTSASSGDTIYIRPGTYTEDLTLKAGVDITGLPGGENDGNVLIKGKMDGSSGSCTIAHVRLTTNSDVIYDVTGTTVNQSAFVHCWFHFTDGDCITVNNANASPVFIDCSFRQTGSDLDLFNVTACEIIIFRRCDLTNSGAVVGTSTIASGLVRFNSSKMQPQKFTTSSTGRIHAEHSSFVGNTDNITPITTAGTGSDNFFYNCIFESGTATSISAGSGTTITVINSSIRSSNSNPVSGAGTVIYSGLDFINTGNGISTTTQTARYTQQGKYRAKGQPAFLAIPDGTKSNVTGDGTVYTVVWDDEIFDQNSNFDGTSTFTAPVTGKYQFSSGVHVANAAINGDFKLRLVTSNSTYMFAEVDPNQVDNNGNFAFCGSVLCDMDSGDTATVTVAVSGGTKITDVIDDPNHGSFFSGILLA